MPGSKWKQLLRVIQRLGYAARDVAISCLVMVPLVHSSEVHGATAFLSPPSNDAEAQTLIDSLSKEIEALRGETKAKSDSAEVVPSEAEKKRAETAQQLLDALDAFQQQIREYVIVRTQWEGQTDSSSIQRLSETLFDIQQRVAQTKAALDARRPAVTEDELREAEQAWRSANDELMVKTTARSDWLKRLAEATPTGTALEMELTAAQAILRDELARAETEGTLSDRESERTLARYRLRMAQVAAAHAQLRLDQARLEAERDARYAEDFEQLLPALRELANVLDEHYEKLKRIRQRSERQRIRDWVEFVGKYPDAVSKFEVQYWPLRLAMLDVLEEINLMIEKAGIADRYTEEKLHDLTSELSGALAIWNQFIASLERRPPEQIQDRFRRIGQRIKEWEAQENRLRMLYDLSFDHRAEIELRLNELDEELRVKIRAAREATAHLIMEQSHLELRQQFAAEKQAYDDELKKIRAELSSLCDRLAVAVKHVSEHLARMAEFRSRLYWSYLTVHDPPLWRFQLSKAGDEWNQEARRQKRAQDREIVFSGFAKVSRTSWMVLAGLALAVAIPAWRLRAKLRVSADQLEEKVGQKMAAENLTLAPLSDRVNFQTMRFAAGTLPVFAPALIAWWWMQLNPIEGRVGRTAILFIVSISVVRALIQMVFGGTKPRFRLLPCSNVVARYYQRWLNLFLVVSLVLVPIPLFLTLWEWAYYSRSYMWSAYKVIMLIMALLFFARRQTILRAVGKTENARHPFLVAVISAVYPLFYIYLVALLVAQILGYGALVTHLIFASVATLGTVTLAYLVVKYVQELGQKLQSRIRSVAEAEAAELASDSHREAELAAGREVALVGAAPNLESELPITLIISMFRLGVWSAVTVLVLGYWGVSWVDLSRWMEVEVIAAGQDGRPPVTVGRAAMAVLVIALSWMVSRTLRSVLETKVFPSYASLDRGGRVAVSTVLHYSLLLIGIYFAMFLMRIPLGAVTVVLGTVGLGLGLASQPLFMNFLSGLIMLFERHVKVGDIVEVEGVLGEVTNISIRATTIKTFDNVDMVIPNSDFVSGRVVNWTLSDARIRGKVPIGVEYGTDPRKVERLLLQIAKESPLVLTEPPPRVRFTGFGDSSLEFALYAWFRNVTDRWDFVTDARFRILEVFSANGIEIPYPQRTFSFKEDQAIRVEVIPPELQGSAKKAKSEIPAKPV